MMPFVELTPPVKAKSATGVRVSMSERWGLVVSVSGPPRELFTTDDALKVLLDPDQAAPRLRIEVHDEGRFRFVNAPGPRGPSNTLMLRVGRPAQLPDVQFRGFDCTWEPVGGARGIDIDLPRELRQVDRAGAKGVSLPKVASVDRGMA